MGETKHTPGPWHHEHHGVVNAGIGSRRYQVAMVTWDHPVLEQSGEEVMATRNANAALIAAAPDMLAALEGVELRCAGMGYVGKDGQFLKVVRAAIAKSRHPGGGEGEGNG